MQVTEASGEKRRKKEKRRGRREEMRSTTRRRSTPEKCGRGDQIDAISLLYKFGVICSKSGKVVQIWPNWGTAHFGDILS